jgi:HAD superfamily hydrolase (TIGR01549 family)
LHRGLNARNVTAELYAAAGLQGQPSSPFDALRAAAAISPGLAHLVDEALRAAELAAIATAPLTPYAQEVIDTARAAGRTVAIVSNNSAASIETFLATHNIGVDHIAGRTSADPRQLKPSPKLLDDTLDRLHTSREHAALVGDSTTDMQVASRAGIAAIGYANRPHKTQTLATRRGRRCRKPAPNPRRPGRSLTRASTAAVDHPRARAEVVTAGPNASNAAGRS